MKKGDRKVLTKKKCCDIITRTIYPARLLRVDSAPLNTDAQRPFLCVCERFPCSFEVPLYSAIAENGSLFFVA